MQQITHLSKRQPPLQQAHAPRNFTSSATVAHLSFSFFFPFFFCFSTPTSHSPSALDYKKYMQHSQKQVGRVGRTECFLLYLKTVESFPPRDMLYRLKIQNNKGTTRQ
ncbi:MAG: hypothetical protein ACK4VI_07960 [Alphaproteobacteria bacterium]